jgi:hypothetical protein
MNPGGSNEVVLMAQSPGTLSNPFRQATNSAPRVELPPRTSISGCEIRLYPPSLTVTLEEDLVSWYLDRASGSLLSFHFL